MLTSARSELDLVRARTIKSPAAFADACSVYCAVDASDSRMRRAMILRVLDETYARRTSCSRTRPLGPDPAGGAGSKPRAAANRRARGLQKSEGARAESAEGA